MSYLKSYKNVLLVLAKEFSSGTFCMTDLSMKNMLANKYAIISIEHFKSSCSLVKRRSSKHAKHIWRYKFE